MPKIAKPSNFKRERSKNRKHPQNLNAVQTIFEFTGPRGGGRGAPKDGPALNSPVARGGRARLNGYSRSSPLRARSKVGPRSSTDQHLN